MSAALFLQSEVADPHARYAAARRHGDVQYDGEAGLWTVYSHAACKRVLEASHAHVPRSALDGLEDEAALIAGQLVRLANPPAHAPLRLIAQRLFERLRGDCIADLTADLLGEREREIDWVTAVCTRLPALALMHGLGFAQSSIDALLPRIAVLSKLMLPAKPDALRPPLHEAARACWPLLQTEAARLSAPDDAAAANLAGLLIQSHDATRGLLSNALLAALALPAPPASPESWRALVQETLRHDPPIHHTRRVMARDMDIGEARLREGEQLLLVLASANRDPAVFRHPGIFDMGRENAREHLGFGAGAHACMAREYAALLTAEALAALFRSHRVRLLQRSVTCAPLFNARLPEEIRIRI